MRSLRILILVSALTGLGGTAAFAQSYPVVVGNCSLSSDIAPSVTNSTATLLVTVRDASGKPLGAFSGSSKITSQPGTGASVPAKFTTSPNGEATLTVKTGDAAGDVRLEVTCGSVSTGGVLIVKPVDVVAGERTPGDTPKPPNTGTGGSDSGSFPIAWFAVASAVLLGAGWLAGSRRRCRS